MGCLKLTYRSETPTLKVVRNTLKESEKPCTGAYRFGFNGVEKDDEISGTTGGHLAYEFREYDSRVARMWSVDPIAKQYPELTPYQHSSLNPIWKIELEGLEGVPATEKTDENGNPTGYTTAQSSTYIPPVNPDQYTSAPADNTSVSGNIPVQQNQTFIGPYNPTGLSEEYLQARNQEFEAQAIRQKALYDMQCISPVTFGNPGAPLGAGMYGSLEAGVKVYSIIEGGYGLYNLGKGAYSAYKTFQFAKSTFEGGKASLSFTLGKDVLKYSGPNFYKFNRQGLSFTTNYATRNSVDVYNSLGLGFQTGDRINSIQNSYTVYQTTMRGFYLSGRIAGQGPSLGGATQFVGFNRLTIFSNGSRLGRTGLGGSSSYNWLGQ